VKLAKLKSEKSCREEGAKKREVEKDLEKRFSSNPFHWLNGGALVDRGRKEANKKEVKDGASKGPGSEGWKRQNKYGKPSGVQDFDQRIFG